MAAAKIEENWNGKWSRKNIMQTPQIDEKEWTKSIVWNEQNNQLDNRVWKWKFQRQYSLNYWDSAHVRNNFLFIRLIHINVLQEIQELRQDKERWRTRVPVCNEKSEKKKKKKENKREKKTVNKIDEAKTNAIRSLLPHFHTYERTRDTRHNTTERRKLTRVNTFFHYTEYMSIFWRVSIRFVHSLFAYVRCILEQNFFRIQFSFPFLLKSCICAANMFVSQFHFQLNWYTLVWWEEIHPFWWELQWAGCQMSMFSIWICAETRFSNVCTERTKHLCFRPSFGHAKFLRRKLKTCMFDGAQYSSSSWIMGIRDKSYVLVVDKLIYGECNAPSCTVNWSVLAQV